jgi:hypothetical protein
VKKRTRPFKVVFKDRIGRIRVSSFETREARELWLARQLAEERGFVTGWTEESPPANVQVAAGENPDAAGGNSGRSAPSPASRPEPGMLYHPDGTPYMDVFDYMESRGDPPRLRYPNQDDAPASRQEL